jgi:hypothetical protein
MKTEGDFIQINETWAVRKDQIVSVFWDRSVNQLEISVAFEGQKVRFSDRARIVGVLRALGLDSILALALKGLEGC